MLFKHRVDTYEGNKQRRGSSGNARPQSFHLAEPLLTDPGINGGTGAPELKKRRAGMSHPTIPQNPREGKDSTTIADVF